MLYIDAIYEKEIGSVFLVGFFGFISKRVYAYLLNHSCQTVAASRRQVFP